MGRPVLQVSFASWTLPPKNPKRTVNRSSCPKSWVFLHSCHNFCFFNTTLHIGSIDEIRTHGHRGLQVIHLMGPPSRYKNQIICFQIDFMNDQLSRLPSLAILEGIKVSWKYWIQVTLVPGMQQKQIISAHQTPSLATKTHKHPKVGLQGVLVDFKFQSKNDDEMKP